MSTHFRHHRQPEPSAHRNNENLPFRAKSRFSEAFLSLSPLLATHPKNCACNPFPCHTCRSKGLKVLYLPHIQNPGVNFFAPRDIGAKQCACGKSCGPEPLRARIADFRSLGLKAEGDQRAQPWLAEVQT